MIKSILFFALIQILTSCNSIDIKRIEAAEKRDGKIKILHITDLHIKENEEIYTELIAIINREKPDLLLITGDSIDKEENLSLLNSFLQELDRDILKLAVPGNWEYSSGVDFEQLEEVYNQNGVQLLINNQIITTIKNRKILIYGTDDWGFADLEGIRIAEKQLNIIMTHRPQYFDTINQELQDYEYYVFSGHTHGGQITLFGLPLFLPPGSGDYTKGVYRKGRGQLIVSKGIGNSVWNTRLFAKPDIYILTY